jgi:CBS domain-containing protein
MQRHIAPLKVKDIMTKEVVTVAPDTDLKKLKEMFERYDFNSFPVVDKDRLLGVVSKLDLLRAFSVGLSANISRFLTLYSRTVEDVMHTATVFVSPEDDVSRAADYMVEFKLRSIPVVDNRRLVGMISRNDIIQCLRLE